MNRQSAPSFLMLHTAMRASAAFTSLSGATFIMNAATFSIMTGFPTVVLHSVGALLLGFALFLLLGARCGVRHEVTIAVASTAVILDWLWVAGSALIAAPGLFPVSNGTRVVIACLAVVVALFAVWQQRDLREAR